MREKIQTAMPIVEAFNRTLTGDERRILRVMNTPPKIQAFLDGLPYSRGKGYRCPLRVLRERRAHCFDGALFGAAVLRRLGHRSVILNLVANREDDDHLLALYRYDAHWGAVAKSNFIGLRFREPIYRNLRELVMSYFEQFYNADHKKTLRSYTIPLNLKSFDKLNWMSSDGPLERIGQRLDEIRRIPILTHRMIVGLSPVDQRSYQAGLLGADKAGLYRPLRKRDKKA